MTTPTKREERHDRGPEPAPQSAARQEQKRRLFLVAAGVLFAAALLVVLFNIESGARSPAERDGSSAQVPPEDIEEYAPPTLDQDAFSRAADDPDTPPDVALERGWIQVADENNRVVQQYRAERLEPQSDNMLELERPEALFFMDDGRVMSLEGDRALARRRAHGGQQGMLESGRITDNVVVQMFDRSDGAADDVDRDQPGVLVLTDEAEFDHDSGELTAPGEVTLLTRAIEFAGLELSAVYDEALGLQRLVVERQTGPFRIVPERLSEESRPAGADEDTTDVADSDAPNDERRTMRRERADGADPAARDARQADRRESREAAPDADWLERRRAAAEDRRRRQAERAGSGEAGETARPQFYRAVFEDGVRIHRRDGEQVVDADEMRIVFSLDNTGLSDSLASTFLPLPRGEGVARLPLPPGEGWGEGKLAGASVDTLAHPLLPLRDILAASILALDGGDADDLLPPPAADDVYIEFGGRLIVTPVEESSVHLASADDVHVELVGSPVRVTDRAQQAVATCATLTYISSEDALALLSSPEWGVELTSPELIAKGERFDYRLGAQEGRFRGAGTMHLIAAAAEPGEPAQEPQEAQPPGPTGGLEIQWSSGVELVFLEQGEGAERGRLEEAIFRGDVVVNEKRFNLAANTLAVRFDGRGGDEADSISEIEAEGAVAVRGLGERGGELSADHLLVEFERDADEPERKSLPRRLVATGDAHVRDREQAIRSGRLVVMMREAALVEGEPIDADASFDRMEVETLLAEEEVEVAMSGARATGDRLFADNDAGVADLTGERVVVSGSQDDADFFAEGDNAHFERMEGNRARVVINGGGHATINNIAEKPQEDDDASATADEPAEQPESVPDEVPQDEETEAPDDPDATGAATAEEPDDAQARVPQPELIHATWRDAFIYEQGREEGAGYIDIRGDVKARTESPLELNTLESVRLEITFAPPEESPESTDSTTGAPPMRQAVVQRLVAKGDARLENRTWPTAERTAEPRLLYIKGQHVEYDQRTLEARVPGPGAMFIRDPRPRTPAPPDAPEHKAELTGRGSTLFEWLGGMRMQQLVDERYTVHMERDVEMIHQSADGASGGGGQNATLTAQSLDVELTRRAGENRNPGLDFGGSTEVARFEAEGRIYLSGFDKEISGAKLVYNRTGDLPMAVISGTRAVPASVKTARSITPLRADEFVWDLATDNIRVTRARGTLHDGG